MKIIFVFILSQFRSLFLSWNWLDPANVSKQSEFGDLNLLVFFTFRYLVAKADFHKYVLDHETDSVIRL